MFLKQRLYIYNNFYIFRTSFLYFTSKEVFSSALDIVFSGAWSPDWRM